ncbi:hypothetical protein V8G54_028828 [Vigna mungo]|uniref:Protein kinase domain-containing protein n=1 Tax=Vigna mungo TaxID=3915 RepID=A0AAQ3MSR6_VIGMU
MGVKVSGGCEVDGYGSFWLTFRFFSCLSCVALRLFTGGSGRKSHQALVFRLTKAGVALLKHRRKKLKPFQFDFDLEEQGSRCRLRLNTGSIWFKIRELEKVTDNFSFQNLIGRGGFGLLYKGTLLDGIVVAIKRFLESDFQGDMEFCNEVEIVSNLKHRNLVPQRGYCVAEESDNYDERGSQRGRFVYVIGLSECKEIIDMA